MPSVINKIICNCFPSGCNNYSRPQYLWKMRHTYYIIMCTSNTSMQARSSQSIEWHLAGTGAGCGVYGP